MPFFGDSVEISDAELKVRLLQIVILTGKKRRRLELLFSYISFLLKTTLKAVVSFELTIYFN